MKTDIKEFDEIFIRNFDNIDHNLDEYLEKLSILTHIFSREF